MIKIQFKGRLGNNMFQYAFGRIKHIENKMKLLTPPIKYFVKTYDFCDGESFLDPINILNDDNLSFKQKHQNIINGYFQNLSYYNEYIIQINEWFKLKSHNIDKNDLIVHVRLTDYIKYGANLKYDYYDNLISKINYNKINLISDDFNHPYILNLKHKYNCNLIKENEITSMEIISSFNKIILSRSTFSWWAAFLSNAAEIYYPFRGNTHNARIIKNWNSNLFSHKFIKVDSNGNLIKQKPILQIKHKLTNQ